MSHPPMSLETEAFLEEVTRDLPGSRLRSVDQNSPRHLHIRWSSFGVAEIARTKRELQSHPVSRRSETASTRAERLEPSWSVLLLQQQAQIQLLQNIAMQRATEAKTPEGGPYLAPWIVQNPDMLLQPAFERLEKIAALEPNWDSFGAIPPTSPAIARTGHLMVAVAERSNDLLRVRVRPWAIAPLSGGVQLEWRFASGAVEIEIDSAGNLGYLLDRGEGSDRRYEEEDDISFDRAVELVLALFAT